MEKDHPNKSRLDKVNFENFQKVFHKKKDRKDSLVSAAVLFFFHSTFLIAHMFLVSWAFFLFSKFLLLRYFFFFSFNFNQSIIIAFLFLLVQYYFFFDSEKIREIEPNPGTRQRSLYTIFYCITSMVNLLQIIVFGYVIYTILQLLGN